MPAVKMSRITLVGLTEDKSDVVEALMNLGAVEIDNPADSVVATLTSQSGPASQADFADSQDLLWSGGEADPVNQINRDLVRLQKAVEFCRHHDPEARKLGSARRPVSSDAFLAAGRRELEIMEQVGRLEQLQADSAELKAGQARDQVLLQLLGPWQSVGLDLSLPGTEQTRVFLGSFAASSQLENFQQFLLEEAPETHVEILAQDENSIRCAILTWQPRELLVQGSLRRSGFHLLPLQGSPGTPAQQIAAAQARLLAAEQQQILLASSLATVMVDGQDFELLHDFYLFRSQKWLTQKTLPGTGSTFYLSGWIPVHLAKSVEKGLRSKFLVALAIRPPEPAENPPVLLLNHPLVKPYEVIVEMFSPPSSADVDPTPMLAPFFFFFFGMMLSDVGYGLVLTLACGWLAFKKKAGGGLGRMARMLFLSGIGATVWGLLFGGFFGDLLTVVSSGRIVLPSLWFNPMDEPMKLMIWSMLFGALHLFTGMGAKIYMLGQSGQWADALLDIAPWYLVISGLGLMIGGSSLGGAFPAVGQYMALAGAAVLLLFGGRSAKNPIMRLVKGLLSLYNVTGYFSDILSYTRILALVLATSVIAMVVNQLGFLGGPTFLGYLGFAVVAILGHSLNLALSALSAYVHTSRLHYVEFFGKFYDGGGRLWKPLQIATRYTEVHRDATQSGSPESAASITINQH